MDSSPSLRAEGGENSLVQQEDTDRISRSLCIAFSGFGSGSACLCSQQTLLFPTNISALHRQPGTPFPNLPLPAPQIVVWSSEVKPQLYFFRFIFCFIALNPQNNNIQCSSVPADLSPTVRTRQLNCLSFTPLSQICNITLGSTFLLLMVQSDL